MKQGRNEEGGERGREREREERNGMGANGNWRENEILERYNCFF